MKSNSKSMHYSKGKRSHDGSKMGNMAGEDDLVNIDESSKVYGSTEQQFRAPFRHKPTNTELSTERLRSNSVEDRPDCRSHILPQVDQSFNAEKLSNLIKKNLTDREALKRDLNSLKQKKPEREPTILGEGEQLRLELI